MTKLDELIAALEKAIQDYKDALEKAIQDYKDARDKATTLADEKWYAVWRLGDAAEQLSWSGPYTEAEYAFEAFPYAQVVNLTEAVTL